jgi:hypothetical protein
VSRDTCPIHLDDEEHSDDDSELEEVTSTNVQGLKRGGGASNMKGKKPKTSGDHWLMNK